MRVEPEDQPAVERLARYIMRPPISLERISLLAICRRGSGAAEKAEVSNGRFHRGFGFRMRGTFDGAGKQIPIPTNQQM